MIICSETSILDRQQLLYIIEMFLHRLTNRHIQVSIFSIHSNNHTAKQIRGESKEGRKLGEIHVRVSRRRKYIKM